MGEAESVQVTMNLTGNVSAQSLLPSLGRAWPYLLALRLRWGVAGRAHLLSPPLWAEAQKLVVYLQEDVIHSSSGPEAARAQRAPQPIPTHALISSPPPSRTWPGLEGRPYTGRHRLEETNFLSAPWLWPPEVREPWNNSDQACAREITHRENGGGDCLIQDVGVRQT